MDITSIELQPTTTSVELILFEKFADTIYVWETYLGLAANKKYYERFILYIGKEIGEDIVSGTLENKLSAARNGHKNLTLEEWRYSKFCKTFEAMYKNSPQKTKTPTKN
ncbi:hypothetical protein [Niabella hibiscisoli]|uniref:hypothetical protein n=1 Tax=Niabella hibiscisoli TaxID=1825928 RepID=UPI001F0FA5E8|nr:hypothetical protein [Niabella hibiscisoli]MCH5716704.1 hypothetical protein [Niabella hibiscisoli]